jgi:hypothetical protein
VCPALAFHRQVVFESNVMPLWKPLLLLAPVGLVLGMIGGNLAKPVVNQRESDGALQAMFQTRAERYGLDSSSPAQAASPTYYDGGYSFVPDWATRSNANWSPPTEDAWSYSYAAAPLPTLAQLDARQAALLADPDKQFAVHQPVEASEAPDVAPAATTDAKPPQANGDSIAMAGESVPGSPEPRRADGEPAIW